MAKGQDVNAQPSPPTTIQGVQGNQQSSSYNPPSSEVTQAQLQQDAAAKIAAAGGASTQTPLGVPPGYIPPHGPRAYPALPGATTGWYYSADNMPSATGAASMYHPKLYVDGDQWQPGKLHSDQIMALQDKLIQAGVLDPHNYSRGVWDKASADAYGLVMGIANGGGHFVLDTLAALDKSPIGGKGGVAAQQRAPSALTPIADYEAAAASASQDLMGGGLSTAEAQQIGQYGQGLERQALAAEAAATPGSTVGHPGTFEQAPAPGTAAREYLLAHNQADIKAYQTAYNAIHFADMLREL